MEIDDTGGWGSWVTLSKAGINLTAGEHVLKVVMDERSTEEEWLGDFDWFTFTPEGTGAITYDANGNMTSEGGKCYEYNEANKLKKVTLCSNNETIAEYIYNYKGQRMVKKNYTSGTLANTVISWSDSFETRDIVGGSIETTNYYFANGELVAKKNPDGSKVYFHNDHLGSTTLTTNQAGAQVEVTSYDPWGKILGAATQSKFLYTGQEHDAETGLHYYDARYYDPDLKRFTQPDTIIQDVYNPQALNRYSYAMNNPLKYTDPSGHFSLPNILTHAVKGLQSAAKALSTWVSSYIPKPTPPPAVSTYRLPNNPVFQQPISRGSSSSGGGGSSGGGNSGGGGSSGGSGSLGFSVNNSGNITPTQVVPNPKAEAAWNNGSVNSSVSSNVWGPISANVGIAENKHGNAPTSGLSLGPGFKFGAAGIYSNKPIEPNSVTLTSTLNVGKAYQWSAPITDPLNWTYDGEGMGILVP